LSRDSLEFVTVLVGPGRDSSIQASCSFVMSMAGSKVVADKRCKGMMHEAHIYQYDKVAPTDSNEEIVLQARLGHLTDELYDYSEISVLCRLVSKLYSRKVERALRNVTNLELETRETTVQITPFQLRCMLRKAYYERHSLELIHHAKQHMGETDLKNIIMTISSWIKEGKQSMYLLLS
jgi:hypothetical protein